MCIGIIMPLPIIRYARHSGFLFDTCRTIPARSQFSDHMTAVIDHRHYDFLLVHVLRDFVRHCLANRDRCRQLFVKFAPPIEALPAAGNNVKKYRFIIAPLFLGRCLPCLFGRKNLCN